VEQLIKIGAKVVSHSRYRYFKWQRWLCRRRSFGKSLPESGGCVFWQYLRGRDDVWNWWKPGSGTEGNGGGVPKRWEKAGFW